MTVSSTAPRLVYITTHGSSAFALMRGQLSLMKERGFDVIVIASPSEELDRAAAREGVRAIGVEMEREINPLGDLRAVWELVALLKELQPDIVNAGTPKAGLLGMLAALIARVPARIYTLRGLRLETTRGLKSVLLNTTERMAAMCSQKVICVSHSLRDAFVQRGLAPLKKCVVLGGGSSNGVHVRRFQLTAEQHQQAAVIREQLQIPNDVPVIGFVGRLTRDKGIVELFQAFEHLRVEIPDLHLLLVGDFEIGDPVPQSTVQHLREHPAVRVTGFVPSTELYYDLMQVLAFPSYREGFPNVPLEAAAAGLPVVGFAATGTIDAVQDGVTGKLVPIGDVVGLTEALRGYLRDDLLRFRHGDAGRQRVARDFRNETIWNALYDLYCEVLPAERRPHLASQTLPMPPAAPLTATTRTSFCARYGISSVPRSSFYRAIGKRLLDLAISVPIAIAIAPVLALAALLIKLDSRGPIFFVQQRLGRYGSTFCAYKFRTMTDRQRTANSEVLPGHGEVTRVGHWLRRFKIDELPQLLNVLNGDMSIIGPRPALPDAITTYDSNGLRRLLERPGLTGFAQVNGNIYLSWPERWIYDAQYVDRLSFACDIAIIFKTVAVVLLGEDRFLNKPAVPQTIEPPVAEESRRAA